jgi:cellulose synthase/poly-beta-1,6-N-acetylglucosamine synthase-like glycosyltransferase
MPEGYYVFYLLILGYFISLNAGYLTLVALSYLEAARAIRRARITDFKQLAASPLTVPVSVVVAAHNEERSVVDFVYSALKSKHPEFEVIVVDDGSTDDTVGVLQREFALETAESFRPAPIGTHESVHRVYRSRQFPQLAVISKRNGGKADAVNTGVNLARFRFVFITDADSLLHPEALIRASRALNDDPGRVCGLGGQLRIKNGLRITKGEVVGQRLPSSLVTRFAMVEYLGAFLGNRLGWSRINGVPVLSGGFNMWRRDVLVGLGGMASDTTHEDIEFTVRAHEELRRRGEPYQLAYLPDPVVYTEVPGTWKDLYRQRKRWQRVLYEVVWKFRKMWFNPRYGTVGLVTMPYLLVYEAIGPWVEVASYIVVGVLFALGFLDLQLLLLFLLLSWGLMAVIRILSIFLDVHFFDPFPPRAIVNLLFLALLEGAVYRPVVLVARLHALIEFLVGHKGWEKMARQNSFAA